MIVIVAGSTRDTLTIELAPRWGRELPTHTAPAPAATAAGIEFAVKCPVIAFVRGSMRVTFASSVSSAQTAPSPTARLLGVTGDSMNAL